MTHGSDDGGFGTTIGGICSLFISFFFFNFVLIQLYTWYFKPNYNQTINIDYQPLEGAPKYDMPTSLFLPAFSIYNEEDKKWNDLDIWYAKWIQLSLDA